METGELGPRGGGKAGCPSPGRAPFLKITPLFILGILANASLDLDAWFLFLTVLGVWSAALVLAVRGLGRSGRLEKALLTVFLGGTLVVSGGLRFGLDRDPRRALEHLASRGQELHVRGRVVSAPKVRGNGVRFDLAGVSIQHPAGWGSVQGGLRVWARTAPGAFFEGDRVELTGRVRAPPGRRNPAGFDYRAYLAHRGIYGLVSVYEPANLERLGPTRRGWLARAVFQPLRQTCHRRLGQHLRGRSLALASGLLLGERERLPRSLVNTLRDAGVLHILTVSGLHVGLVVGVILVVGRAVRVPLGCQVLLALCACFLYSGVAGSRAPVIRASVMAAVGLVGLLLERDTPGLNMLSVAALVLLLLRPAVLWDVGFQLSFAAVFGIVAFFPILRDSLRPLRRGWFRRPVDGLLVSLGAQLGVGPLVAYHFSTWTPVSLAANLLVLPEVGLAVPLTAASIAAGSLSDALAQVLFATLWAVLQLLSLTGELMARVPFGAHVVERPAGWLVVASYGGLVLAFLLLARRRWKGLAVSLAGLSVLLVLYLDPARPGRMEMTVLDVGLGSAAVLEFPSGTIMLVDGGDRSPYRDYGDQVVVPYLRSRGIGTVDGVVLTHPHQDHFGGLRSVVDDLSVGLLVDPGLVTGSEGYLAFLRSVQERGVPFRVLRRPNRTVLPCGAQIDVIPIDPESRCRFAGSEHERLNNGSLVLRVAYGRVVWLITGDIEACREADLIRRLEELDCDVVIAPHHGSPSSSSPAFVEALSPEIAVVSVGRRGGFRLPSEEVVARYREAGARVLRTDERGAVILTTDGKHLWTRWTVGWEGCDGQPPSPVWTGQWLRGLITSGLVLLVAGR